MSDRYNNNLRLDEAVKERMARYEYNGASRAVESNIENERMSDISSESSFLKRDEDDDDGGEDMEEDDDGLSASSLEEMDEEVVPSGASFLIGERTLLASSARSRTSSSKDGAPSHEPIASRFLRSNNTWAHKEERLSSQNYRNRTSWNSGELSRPYSNYYRHRLGEPPRNRSKSSRRQSSSRQSSSSFSPLSYVDDTDDQLRSLSQLQNEALGSWLRLRPRDGPQAQSCMPFFTGNSSLQQSHGHHPENLCYPKYPITMVTESLGEAKFLNNDNSYHHISSQGGQLQHDHQNNYSESGNSSCKIDGGEGTPDDTLHRHNLGDVLDPKNAAVENAAVENGKEIQGPMQTISIPNEDIENNDDAGKEETVTADDPCENRSLDKNNGSKDLSQRSTGKSINWASPDSKYERYMCRVDRQQGDRAQEITLFLFARPHMRGFHFAWFSFFVAFFIWFAISPLLAEIRDTLDLDHNQIWTSNTYSSAGTIFFRLLAGPLCDTYGARTIMALCLVLGSLPVMAIGLVHNATELYIVRLLTGISGASFVICQYWTSSMFIREIAGTANSLASGWGNLGGGVAQIIMGSVLFPLFKLIYGPEHSHSAWRSMFILPAVGGIITAFCIMKYSDDTPKGNYRKLSRLGIAPEAKIMKSFRLASMNPNTWFLFVQYAGCFGVEVTMTTGAALYFIDEFEQTTEAAAALASIFGWLNLFARGLGGFISDIMNVKMGMRGRLLWQMVSLVAEGAFIICFGYAKTLGAAIGTMVAFSLFVQTSEGSTYSIVPYVCPRATGSVAGIVGAGGNVGGVVYLFLITKLNYNRGFVYMGWSVICSALLCFIVNIPGYSKGLRRLDNLESGQVLEDDDDALENGDNDLDARKVSDYDQDAEKNEDYAKNEDVDKTGSASG